MNAKKIWMVAAAMTIISITCGNAVAACTDIMCFGKISRLYTANNGNLYIGTDGDEKKLNCTAVADVYITLPANDPNFNRKYALLLSAFTMKSSIGLRINTGSNGCTLNYIAWDNN